MTTTTTILTIPIYTNSDAGFRLWAKVWHDAMIAAGCSEVHSSINLDTMVLPTTSGALVAGHKVYSFNDSLHATHPLFVKLEWGKGNTSQAAGGLKLQISVGREHSGGAVTGDVFSQYIATHRDLTETGELIVTRYDAGLSLFINSINTTTGGFLVERTCLNGTVVGDGVAILVYGTDVNSVSSTGANSAGRCADHILHNVYASNSLAGYDAPIMASYSTTPEANGKIPLYPVFMYGGYDTLRGAVGASSVAVTANKRFVGSYNGVSGTYRSPNGSYPLFGNGNRLCFLVEDV